MAVIPTQDYLIEICSLPDSGLNAWLNENCSNAKVAILVDENTHDFCLEYLLTSFTLLSEAEVFLLPVGEENKNLEICTQIWGALSEYQFGRKDIIINLGGGMVSDLGGFIASTYKRGLSFINIPTSLLAMVDASVGGKTGVNFNQLKNLIGTFAKPKAVFIDPAFITTLPIDEIVNGYAEMLKHGLIDSVQYWEELKDTEDWNVQKLSVLIEKSVQIKNTIVEADFLEQGLRKKLNFGHTLGHGIESYFMDQSFQISHGVAVAYGIICENYISFKKGLLSLREMQEIETVILSHYALIDLKDAEIEAIIELIKNDKKNEQNTILCCLLESIGQVLIDQKITEREIFEALTHLKDLNFNLN